MKAIIDYSDRMNQHNTDNFRGVIIWQVPLEEGEQGIPEALQDLADGRDFVQAGSPEAIAGILDRVEIAIGHIPFSLVPKMPNLKWAQMWSAGADILQRYPELKAHPFKLTSTSGMHRQQIAEHAFGMILARNRRLDLALEAQMERRTYRPSGPELDTLEGKKMFILGYGAVGSRIAEIAKAFGMEVTGFRRSASNLGESGAVRELLADRFIHELPQADYVVNMLPYTQDTHHYFGEAQLRVMKKTAVYVNLGRGGTTDEQALINALKSRAIAWALLDVSEIEPLPADSELWNLDNVFYTSHYSGASPLYTALALEVCRENFERYTAGDPLINLINKEAGY